ncbi:MAG: FtsX-like permease family protein [Longimicrobiales bacterium]
MVNAHVRLCTAAISLQFESNKVNDAQRLLAGVALRRTHAGQQRRVRCVGGHAVQSLSLADDVLLEGRGDRDTHRVQVVGSELSPFGERELPGLAIRPNYFATIGLSFTRGRDFSESDLPESSRVVIINETFARRAFAGQNPLGRQLRLLTGNFRDNGEPLEIIGVVTDAAHNKLGEEAQPILYRPLKQSFFAENDRVVVVVRTRHDARAILPSIASLAKNSGPEIKLSQSTLADNIARQTLPSRIASTFFGMFGGLGLLLAVVGLAGVLAYAVASRTKEIGIRMALGAKRTDVVRMIIREGLALTLAGIAVGVPLALALTRLLTSYFYGISAADPLTYVAITLLLTTVAWLACSIPARRAAQIEPLTALRHQ